MTHEDTGTGWPDERDGAAAAPPPAEPPVIDVGLATPDIGDQGGVDRPTSMKDGAGPDVSGAPPRRRFTIAGAMIGLLLALVGFALVVQLKSNASDSDLDTARPEDLVRILSDLQAREDRLRQETNKLEETQRQLASGAEGRQAALDEARRRADELGILAGTLPAEGTGLTVTFSPGGKPIKAQAILDAVEELRGAGAEAMQISGGPTTVRIVASTAFVDDGDGLLVGGQHLPAPYVITVIGDPQTMQTALNIPGGVVESVAKDGGSVTMQEARQVQVTATQRQGTLKFAQPVS